MKELEPIELIEEGNSAPKRKQIIFNVSEHDHRTIKEFALKKGVSIRTLIINAIAAAIKKEMEIL